jgi:hypothetical protein
MLSFCKEFENCLLQSISLLLMRIDASSANEARSEQKQQTGKCDDAKIQQ